MTSLLSWLFTYLSFCGMYLPMFHLTRIFFYKMTTDNWLNTKNIYRRPTIDRPMLWKKLTVKQGLSLPSSQICLGSVTTFFPSITFKAVFGKEIKKVRRFDHPELLDLLTFLFLFSFSFSFLKQIEKLEDPKYFETVES